MEGAVTTVGSRQWMLLAYGYGALVVVGFAYTLLGMPIQITDGYTNMMSLPGRTLLDGVYNEFYQESYLRPFLWAHHQILFTLADGRYFEWFRGWHVFQVAVLTLLFIRLLRPTTAAGTAVVPLGLAVLTGIHTFAGTVREAFPVNTFMTVLLCCAGAANLAMGPTRWWRDVLAALLFVFAALTVESGLLVWVVFAAAYLAGARGVSRAGIIALTLLFGGYFYLRSSVLEIGGPGLIERSSGYGFSMREPEQLIEMFGANPLPFYAYNVLTSIASVLWSEPRYGVWQAVRAWTEGEFRPFMAVNIIASTLATAVVVMFLWRRRRLWLTWKLETADQQMFMFFGVLAANAVISYPYTKDVIMSPAGLFYALAVAVATRDVLQRAPRRSLAAVATGVLLLVMSGAWAIRATGIHPAMRESAAAVRNEWALIDQWLQREGKEAPPPDILRMQNQLQQDAIVNHPAPPALRGDWLEWMDLQ